MLPMPVFSFFGVRVTCRGSVGTAGVVLRPGVEGQPPPQVASEPHRGQPKAQTRLPQACNRNQSASHKGAVEPVLLLGLGKSLVSVWGV